MSRSKRRLAFIVQRYGLEVNGGAEAHCRQLAEKLAVNHDVEILTTCALDYTTWLPYYQAGECIVNGIKVTRFLNREEKSSEKERYFMKILVGRIRLLRDFKLVRFVKSFFSEWKSGDLWIKARGPYCEDLVTFLKANHQNYDVLIFMTYLYYPTVFGLRVAPYKSLLIPTAHDEAPIYLPPFKSVFTLPKFLMFNTESEKRFVHRVFNNTSIAYDIAGVGLEMKGFNSEQSFKEEFKIDGDYIIYIGRIDTLKGVGELFEMFAKYQNNGHPITLVLIGQAFIQIPETASIRYLGFVSDEVKNRALQEAMLLVLPSQFESLSMVVLESLFLKVPVLVNGKCDVLVEHCDKSGGGFYYTSTSEFLSHLDFAVKNRDVLKQMGNSGQIYVQNNYQWDVVLSKFEKAFDLILG